MKKSILIIITIVLIILVVIFVALKNKNSDYIKVTSISGKAYNAMVGDNIEGVEIIEIKNNKVIVKHGNEEPEECKYGKRYEFWPDSQNGTVFYEEPETVLTFEK